MRVVLVPAPMTSRLDEKLHPPLGIIMVGTALARGGFDVRVADCPVPGAGSDARASAATIMALEPDVVGFSTMCGSYPLTLKICAACKRIDPAVGTVLGGPQATATAEETIRVFPEVDLVVRGECELTVAEIFRSLPDRGQLARLPGVTFMDGTRLFSTPLPPPLLDLDELPLPDYTLYSGFRDAIPLPVEVGRGCPGNCRFCCLRVMSRGRHRFFSPGRIVSQLRELCRSGIRRFQFLHDAVSHDRAWLLELCSAIREAGLDITWDSSARVDEVDSELLAEMAAAGCTGLFFGIESGSTQVQQAIGKGLHPERVPAALGDCLQRGIDVSTSFIIGFPEETMVDVAQTLRLATASFFGQRNRATISLHLLTPLAGSPLMDQYGAALGFDGVFSDLVVPGLVDGDEELIRSKPRLFSAFHHYPTPHLPRTVLTRLPFLFLNLFQLGYTLFWLWREPAFDFPESLLTHPLLAALPWRSHEESSQAVLADLDTVVAFVRDVLRSRNVESPILEALLRYDRAMVEAGLHGSALERFDIDVAGMVRSIRTGGFSALPAEMPRQRNDLYFKREGTMVTVRRIAAVLNPLPESIRSLSDPG